MSKMSLPDLFTTAAYKASQTGALRAITLAEMEGTVDDVKDATILAEVSFNGGIVTCIYRYSQINNQCNFINTIPGAFNCRGDVIVKTNN